MQNPIQSVFNHAVRTYGRDKNKVEEHMNNWLNNLQPLDRQRIGKLHYHVDLDGNVLSVENIMTTGQTNV